MSLVEKALRKLQDGASRVPATSAALSPAVEAVVTRETPARRTLATPEVPRPDRVISINRPALQAVGLLPPESQERALGQQYRQIKRPLISGAIGRGASRLPNGHVILLASAVPGEGKTFTSINLAFSMSMEKDIHVLLVDADVAKRHISKVLSVGDAPGLLDLLRDPSLDVDSVILPTDMPNLSILPAGTASDQATELLASERMEQIVRVIGERDRHRVVLFDSPPVLHTTECHALIQIAGQIVVVVRAGVTPQQVLLDALSYLGEHPSVSLILNQSIQSSPEAYYRYGQSDSLPERPQK